MKGRKPTPTVLRLITGNPGRRPLPPADPLPAGSVERPPKLNRAAGELWDGVIARCYWLTWADSTKAEMWCFLMAEYRKSPVKMIASRIAQLRALGSELGLDQAARTRLGLSTEPKTGKRDPAAKYLDNPADEFLNS